VGVQARSRAHRSSPNRLRQSILPTGTGEFAFVINDLLQRSALKLQLWETEALATGAFDFGDSLGDPGEQPHRVVNMNPADRVAIRGVLGFLEALNSYK
jgi:hypothetical protein